MGRRADLLQLDTPESQDRAVRVLRECSDLLDDDFHVTLVEDLRDIADSIATLSGAEKADAER